MLINLLILFSAGAFLVFAAVILRGLQSAFANNASALKILPDDNFSFQNISIVIAARNEEENIKNLFASLASQNYPEEKFELIFVDDNSNDNTFIIAKELSENILNKKIIESKKKTYSGKKGALQIGIENASFENILITDADCLPQSKWLGSFSQKFFEGYDLIFGISPLKAKNNFKLPLFDNLRTSLLTFASAGLNQPYSAAARSFGFSMQAFQKIKGYENVQETLSGDDDLLIRETVKNNLKIGILTKADSFVYSNGKGNLKDYLHQKSRHVKTSFHYLAKHKLFLSAWHIFNITFTLSPLLGFISLKFIALFFIKIIFDLILIKKNQIKFGYNFTFGEIIAEQILYEIFLIINFINAAFRKDKWK